MKPQRHVTAAIDRTGIRDEIRIMFGHSAIRFNKNSITVIIDTKWNDANELAAAATIVIRRTMDLIGNRAYAVVDDKCKYGDSYSGFRIHFPQDLIDKCARG